MRGPGRRGDQVAVGDGFRHGQVDVRAASLADVGTNGGIGTALFPFEDSRGGEDLRGVADGCDGFVGLGVVVDDFDHAWDEADVFGGTTAGENQGVVVFGPDLVERAIESEIVAALFGVGLVAFEIVDRGADGFAGFFSGAHRMDGMADHQKRLKRNHNFVVFDIIADEHENRFFRHGGLRISTRITEMKMPDGQAPAGIACPFLATTSD